MKPIRKMTLALALAALSALAAGTSASAEENNCTIKVAINKIGDPYVTRGGETVHYIAIHNVGTCTLTGPRLVDTLDPAMGFENATGSPYAKPSSEYGGQVKWKGDEFPAGASAVVAVKVKISREAPDFITNTACLTIQGAVATSAAENPEWSWCDSFTSHVRDRGEAGSPAGDEGALFR